MDGKKRIARLRNQEGWKKGMDVLAGFRPRDGPKVLKVVNTPQVEAEASRGATKKSSIFTSAREFRRALEKRGFKLLGEGHYSAVYGKDGYDRVIKVSRTLDNWIDYVAWASKNGFAGTFAPKVYSWKRFKGPPWVKPSWMHWDSYDDYKKIGNDWSVAIVERMAETLNADSQLAQDFKLVERLHDLPEKSLLAEVILDEIIPGVGSFFKKLHRNFRASDIYAKNMMIRKDGTFCVTDPVCGSIKTEARRLKAGDFTPPLVNYWR